VLPIVVVLAVGGLMPGVAGARPHASGTRIKIVAPIMDGRLAAGYTKRSEHSGHCEPGTRGGGINLSFRCFAGNRVYETCLAAPGIGSGVVACVDSPWMHRLDLVRTTRAIHGNSARPVSTGSEPWGIELSNGTRCGNLFGVMHGEFHHRLIDFSCGDRNTGLVGVLRGLDRTTNPWTADAVIIPHGTSRPGCRELPDGPPRCSRVRRIDVSAALFGQDLPAQPASLALTGPPFDLNPGAGAALAALLILIGSSTVWIGRRRRTKL
jgi:hypothetical protein